MTLQLTQGKSVADKNPRNAYVLYAEGMHGDADGYTTIQLGPFAPGDTSGLETALRVLEAMKELNRSNWNGACENYSQIPGFEEHFGEEWPKDNEYRDDMLARYESHHIRFFDEQGQEYEVSYALS